MRMSNEVELADNYEIANQTRGYFTTSAKRGWLDQRSDTRFVNRGSLLFVVGIICSYCECAYKLYFWRYQDDLQW